MDVFLTDVHTCIFKAWILLQDLSSEQIIVNEKNDNTIELNTKYSHSEIVFHEMNIIEMSVENTQTKKTEFYLHFQVKTLNHAIELFNEMLDCIKNLVNKPITKILLSCSSGLTTGYFAQKLNEAIELLNLNYHIDAVSYNELFNVGDQYELVMLAPQISYMEARVQSILNHQTVLKIPSSIFAKYDTVEMIKLIESQISSSKQKNKSEEYQLSYRQLPEHPFQILCIQLIRNSNRVHIIYSLYNEKNQCILENEIIKKQIVLQDIYDVIDMLLATYSAIGIIGMTLPGIINDGYISSVYVEGLNNKKLEDLFTHKYHKKFVYSNDVNAAALGYYASHDEYESVSFLFQPLYFRAGAGSVVNGHLLTGKHHISGEVKLLPLNLSKSQLELIKTPEGAIELVAKMITALCVTIDPEIIALCCQLIPDISDLEKELLKYLPKEYLPKIEIIQYMHVYMFLGQLILCIESIEKDRKEKQK